MRSAAPVRSRPATVLVVDDDAALSRMLRLTLREGGFDVVLAPDGLAALREVEDHRPDAIVLDLEMPGMNGRRFYRELLARGMRIPVIIVSASDGTAAQRELGADAALAKPFDPEDLVRGVRELLSAGLQ